LATAAGSTMTLTSREFLFARAIDLASLVGWIWRGVALSEDPRGQAIRLVPL